MKITLKEIWNSQNTLYKILNHPFEDFKTSYAISRIASKINSQMAEIEQARQKTLEKYYELKDGEPLIKDGKYVLKDENKFKEEWGAYLDKEIEMDTFTVAKEALAEVKLSPNELSAIDKFLK